MVLLGESNEVFTWNNLFDEVKMCMGRMESFQNPTSI